MKHHPSEERLLSYAAGRLSEGLALAVVTHLAYCQACAAATRSLEAVAGALLEIDPPVGIEASALDRVLARLDEPLDCAEPVTKAEWVSPLDGIELPLPLAAYVPPRARWRTLAPGISHIRLLPRDANGGNLRLLWVSAGTPVAAHSHAGREMTVVLQGAYVDEFSTLGPGDFGELDHTVTHRPVATPEAPCICLIATDAPLRFKGLVGRVTQPFFGL